MIKRILLLVAVVFSFSLEAQDFHFSQFYATPTLLNPAMTGNHGAGYRLGGINRSQFAAGANNFQTISLYGDVALAQNELAENSWVGLGGSLYYDNAGQGAINTFHMAGQLTLHKAINDNVYLSFGGGFGFTGKSLNTTGLTFNNQFGEDGLDPTLGSDESFVRDGYMQLDVDAGVAATYTQSKNTRFTLGFALLHVNRPAESYYFATNTSGNNRVGVRPVVHFNATIGLEGFHIEPGALFSTDRGARELIVGSNFSYELNADSRVVFGIWNRWSESVIPLVGFEFMRTRILASYDLNVQSIAGSTRQAFEISLAHTGKWRERTGGIACPRF